MKRFRAALKNKSNWPSLVTLVLILACSLFSFWDTQFSEQARSTAFALVAVEFFIMLVVHLDEVKTAVGEIKSAEAKGPYLVGRTYNTRRKMIAEAKECLFFCGNAPANLVSLAPELINLSDRVKVRILVADIEDENVVKIHYAINGREPEMLSLSHLKKYAQKANFEIRLMNCPMVTHMSAKDVNTASGQIHVSYAFFGEKMTAFPRVDITPADTEWYAFYKEQIELLWAQGTPWTPSTKEGTS